MEDVINVLKRVLEQEIPFVIIGRIADLSLVIFPQNGVYFPPYKPLPPTSNALVVRHLVIHEASTYVVLGFIWRAGGHPPNDDSDSITGVAGWALSFHRAKLLRVTDKSRLGLLELPRS